ncbi:MAG: DJ-1/PfpI family protein [Candidatus Micrarchaeota archaeon]|nr:DJ-1/PfpI family protein [Candidatus Micrarchaeota archaeon]MDE1804585.1 DJ-1/PfpI family protein [Candidatus Micrarchaeota archaeon]MDE1846484.1 DJ-1/PfpI family protein [Candidatus Micrarchaeota archaeon]
MRALIVITPRNFRDETVSLARLLFGKWGVTPVIASYTKGEKECVGTHGAIYKPELNATKLTSEGFDALLVVDGPGVDEYKLHDFRPLLDLIKDFVSNKKVVGAIGNSVKVVARANVITDRTISAPKDEEISRLVRIYRGRESEKPIEYDKFLLTARNPQSAEQFLNAMLEQMGVK